VKNTKCFYFSGILLLEGSSLQSAEHVDFWNGLHYFNVHGKNLPHNVILHLMLNLSYDE